MHDIDGEKLPSVSLPIIVEGRYDKSAILSFLSATVITTEGFGIFNSKEKQALIRKISEGGVIVLTDSDGGGAQIRAFLSGIIPKEKIFQAYVPKIAGKEKRKPKASKAGLLGVEGVGKDAILKALSPYISDSCPKRNPISPALLFSLGLSGGEGSQAKRDLVAEKIGLISGMSAKAFRAAVELVATEEDLSKACALQ